MKRLVLFLLLLPFLYCLSETETDGQALWRLRRWEGGAGLGTSFFFGDVGGFSQGENALGFKDFTFLQTRFSGLGTAKYRVLEDVSIRLNLAASNLKANDRRGSNTGRGDSEAPFAARIFIFEPSAMAEFYFIKNGSENSWLFNQGRGGALRRFLTSMDFYAFAGIGAAFFNVDPNETLSKADPLNTKFNGVAPVMPLGIGGTLIYSPEYNFGIELGGRYSFSDYIDGYSNDNFSRANDVYYFLNLTFTYKMTTGRNGLPEFLNRSNRRRR